MDIELTKDAQKLVAALYKSYLERRKQGMSKADAKEFQADYIYSLSQEAPSDVDDTLNELIEIFDLKMNILGDIELNSKIISYMENRFKNGLVDVLSFLAQFIP